MAILPESFINCSVLSVILVVVIIPLLYTIKSDIVSLVESANEINISSVESNPYV